MLSSFEQAVSGAFTSLQGAAGIRVTYRRTAASGASGNRSVELTVVPGSSRFMVDDGGGFRSSLRTHDFFIASSELQFDGQITEPQAGDQIEIQRLDGVHVCRVMSPGGGEPEWRYADGGRTRLRVHTKFMETIA